MCNNHQNFGSVLRELRIHREMTQEQLALLIDKTPGAVRQFEKGNIYPGFETLCKIISALDVDANLFFLKETAEYPDEAKWVAKLMSEMSEEDIITVRKFLMQLGNIFDKVRPQNPLVDDSQECENIDC